VSPFPGERYPGAWCTSISSTSLSSVALCQPALADEDPLPHAPEMVVISEADAAALRTIFQQRGEFSAAIELRRLFPGITDNAQARECVRTIASWRPLPKRRLRPARSRIGKAS
jgi:hypothetical protein